MTKAMKARHGGFTLVELLIVIIIIAILAGMLLLATGSATDSADATKLINDVRNVKGAAMMFYVDNNSWPSNANAAKSLDVYIDRSFFYNPDGTTTGKPTLVVASADLNGVNREFIGFEANAASPIPKGVMEKLAKNAAKTGLFSSASGSTATPYATGQTILMVMR